MKHYQKIITKSFAPQFFNFTNFLQFFFFLLLEMIYVLVNAQEKKVMTVSNIPRKHLSVQSHQWKH